MKHLGLIGYPLSHSFSKKYFTEKFEKEGIEDCTYELYPLENIDDLPKLLHKNPYLCGLNVTIPHKVSVLKHLDWIEHDAKRVGAVNCIKVVSQSPVSTAFSGELAFNNDDLWLEGHNTDIYGFDGSLNPLLTQNHDTALILGDGGAARAVKCVLENRGITYKTVTRKPAPGNLLFSELTVKDIEDNKLIINTTPLGTYPNVDECPPIPYEGVGHKHLLFDLVYNPEETLFLKKGKERGATIKNGYEMLVLQAEKAWEIWNSNTVK
ncbi:shikimate dehydrogenase [Mucilaginibacter sp. MD40]|uniref:shikimate dehydrogenase family protein n=1 Tax=Mucilaginibacter sp. MD40 TaxID=2029590 RepID=UPI000BACA8CE|nr:shikimate dehydrogenase [Mucilaginibacter sp. MD40]PAW93036.1 shikimate dehydrogenase [Mucilaginibacter sp. MD40]